MEFWLTDGEEPLPDATPAAPGGAEPPPLWAGGYEPPSEELLGALGALARHVTVVPDAGGPRPAQQGAAWLPFVPLLTPAAAPAARTQAVLAGPSRLGPAASPGAQALARRLFRFHRRAASAWPEARSTRALARALGAILAPWRGASGAGDGQGLDVGPPGAGPPHGHHLADYLTTLRRGTGGRDAVRGRGAAAADHRRAPAADAAGRYSPEWEPHVLAHLPFYTVVLPLFLESAAARLEARGAGAARDVALLLGPLSSSPELCEVLRRAERAAAPSAGRAGAAGGRADAGPYADLAPWLADRAADWEAAAAASWHAPQPGTAPSAPSLFDPATAGGVSSAAAAALDLASAGDQVLPQEGAAALRACLATVFDLERAAGTGASGPAPDRTAGTGDGTRDGDPREVSNDGWQVCVSRDVEGAPVKSVRHRERGSRRRYENSILPPSQFLSCISTQPPHPHTPPRSACRGAAGGTCGTRATRCWAQWPAPRSPGWSGRWSRSAWPAIGPWDWTGRRVGGQGRRRRRGGRKPSLRRRHGVGG